MANPNPPETPDRIPRNRRGIVARFFVRCVALFAFLVIRWPGFDAAYGGYFRALGNAAFHWEPLSAWIHFEPAQEGISHRFDTVIYLGNKDQMGADGRMPVRAIELESRAIGWIPTALMLALVLANPGGFAVRVRRTFVSGLLMLGWQLATLGLWLLHEANSAPALGLWQFNAGVTSILRWFHEILITHFGAGLLVPVLIWMVVSCPQAPTPRTIQSGRPGRTSIPV